MDDSNTALRRLQQAAGAHRTPAVVDGSDHVLHQPPVADLAASGLPDISPRLYNQDLAPTKTAGRRWTS